MNTKTTIIIGGVAGGATVAARLSRLTNQRRIILIERGAHVSFANCGLPYYIGNIIEEQSNLLLASPEMFRNRFGVDVRLRHEATAIDKTNKTITIRNLDTDSEETLHYNELVLSPGAAPFRPNMPGIDLPGVLTLRNIPDAERIKTHIRQSNAKTALIIGAGFIGLEVAENLHHLGLNVSIIEGADHILPPLDSQMAPYVSQLLEKNGINIRTRTITSGIRRTENGRLQAYNDNWQSQESDLIILSIGVRPESTLARQAGLQLGINGSIIVDETMRTSEPGIWAVGDAVQVTSGITGQPMLLALAGVAQKQARVAAADIAGTPKETFKHVWGTSVLRLLGTTIALTGMNRDNLNRAGLQGSYEYVDLHPANHVTYYPGASPIHIRLIYEKSSGRILGATAIGQQDVARRIDTIAMAISMGGTVQDLAAAELCYSPQEGAAKDPVNMAGMAATNNILGLHPIAHYEDIAEHPEAQLIDVREESEVARAPYPGARNIPLSQLLRRMNELDPEKPILVMCQVGVRGYTATRHLLNAGYQARNLSGGYTTLNLIRQHCDTAREQ